MSDSVQEPFRLGRVVGRSFSVWRRNLVLLFALVLVVSLPRILFSVYLVLFPFPPPEPHEDSGGSFFWWLFPYLLRHSGIGLARSLFVYLSEAVVIFAVYQRLRGNAATFGESLRGGMRRILPVVRVALAISVLTTVIWFACWAIFLEEWFELPEPFSYLVWLLIPLVLTPFWVAVPAAVVERSQSFLSRSWILTRGHRLGVFAILLIVYAIDWGTWWLYDAVTEELRTPWRMAVWWILDLLLVALAAVLAVVGYHALRLEKDGVDVTDLEEVFA